MFRIYVPVSLTFLYIRLRCSQQKSSPTTMIINKKIRKSTKVEKVSLERNENINPFISIKFSTLLRLGNVRRNRLTLLNNRIRDI